MRLNILSKEQQDLLPFIQSFEKTYYLVGGTAIALHIGHRLSIDFDMFRLQNVSHKQIIDRLTAYNLSFRLLHRDSESLHIIVHGVKLTFFQFPFKIPVKTTDLKVKIPDLLHLGAMKAYAIGRRSKWKDYVDLYFILKYHHSLEEVTKASQLLFEMLFSPKLFKQQLCYFEDIDYTEEVTFLPGFEVDDETVKQFLVALSTETL